jgi:two-component system, LytTR family, sensor kinase
MRRSVRTWLTAWAAWTSLALLMAISSSLTYRSTGRPANWNLTMSRSLAEWWLWAALTPLVVWLAHRYRLDAERRWRNVAIHLCAGLFIAVSKTLADRAIFALISGFWTYVLLSTVVLQFVVYAAVVAGAHGVEFYRRSREREALERRLAETRLQLLGMQLQPHFLFNTLNTIAELVHHEPDTADQMIVGLSDLLRLTLQLDHRQQVTLQEELALLSKYLDIQRARFGERLHVDIQVESGAGDGLVPILMLQPIVENSIRHGLAVRATAGRIAITARRTGRHLVVQVIDDGIGDGVSESQRGPGVGLANTRARLEALYGADAALELSSSPAGTRVTINVPLASPGAGA